MGPQLRNAVLYVALALPAGAAWANHPVLVEGNCDSPVPGTTIVQLGFCGDFDGDGRIGTAEDTDGADRIFGTISAALGPGTGAAAGTGANQNGLITIVTSGRFAEVLQINAMNGNVTLQAAPGVDAEIDAVLQGDPSGGNNARQASSGIRISADAKNRVVLRNLTVRNFLIGIELDSGNATLSNIRLENNVNFGVFVVAAGRVTIDSCEVLETGFRIGTAGSSPDVVRPQNGGGIVFQNGADGAVFRTLVSSSFGPGIENRSSRPIVIKDNYLFNNNGSNLIGPSSPSTP